jgi:hypothetical protein
MIHTLEIKSFHQDLVLKQNIGFSKYPAVALDWAVVLRDAVRRVDTRYLEEARRAHTAHRLLVRIHAHRMFAMFEHLFGLDSRKIKTPGDCGDFLTLNYIGKTIIPSIHCHVIKYQYEDNTLLGRLPHTLPDCVPYIRWSYDAASRLRWY